MKKSSNPFYTKRNPYPVTHDNGILNLRWLMYMIDFINMPFDYKGSNYGSSDKKRSIRWR